MIGVVFSFLNKLVEVRIDGNNCLFRTSEYGGQFFPIDSMKLDKIGVMKEFPDLKDNENWREEAIKRFKEKIKSMDSEMKRINYLMEEFKKMGYKPIAMQREGHRPMKIR